MEFFKQFGIFWGGKSRLTGRIAFRRSSTRFISGLLKRSNSVHASYTSTSFFQSFFCFDAYFTCPIGFFFAKNFLGIARVCKYLCMSACWPQMDVLDRDLSNWKQPSHMHAHMSAFIKSSTDAEVNRQPFFKISGAIYTGVPLLIFFVLVEIIVFV